MKKVAFVSAMETSPWGGSEELWSRTAQRMAEEGFIIGVNIMGWKEIHRRIQQLEKSNCFVTRRWYRRRNIFWRLAFEMHHYEMFYKWLDKFSPDLVLISQGNNFDGIGWMEACLKREIPYAVVSHIAPEHQWPSSEMSLRALKAYQNAKRSYFVSRRSMEVTAIQLAGELNNISIVRNPFNVSYDIGMPWPNSDVLKLACVARLYPPSKGQDILFKVLSSPKWRSRPLQVTLFGEDDRQNYLMRLRDLWGLESVKFGGFVDNAEDIWASHHGLILPSRCEGLPIVSVEAMLCGRFCIVTDVGGNAELIEDNINGFVAKAPTPDFLDEAMEKAWQRRDSWREIGQVAAVSVRKVIPRDPVGIFLSELKGLLE